MTDLKTPADRVVHLLQEIWHGVPARMSKATGISASAISNVTTGRQQPGRQFLAALAAHPGVNAVWLLTGSGEPLHPDASSNAPRMLFLAEQLFEGLPQDNREKFGAMLEVPVRYYRPSRYWFQIPAGSDLITIESLKLAAGDLVLFEPDPKGWPENLVGHPCILKTPQDELEPNYIAEQNSDGIRMGKLAARPRAKSKDGRSYRAIDLYDDRPNEGRKANPPLTCDSLVAVGIFRMGGFTKS